MRTIRRCIWKRVKADPVERKLVFLADNNRSAGKEISIEDVLEIHDDLVDYMDDI